MKASDAKLTSFFLSHAKRHRKRFIGALSMMPFCALLAVLGPLLVKKAIDEGIAKGNLDLILWVSLSYLGVVTLNFLLTTFQMLLMQTAGVRTLQDIRAALLKHISFFPKSIFEKRPLGVFVNRTTSDVEAVGETIATGLTNLVTDILTIIAIFGVIFYQNLRLGFITIVLLPVIVLIVNFFRKRLRYHHDNIRTVHGKLTAQFNESCAMLYEVNNFHLAGGFQKEFNDNNRLYMKESVKAISYDALIYSILEGLSFLVIGLVLFCISRSWFLTEFITIGQLIMYLQLLEVLFAPVKQMGQRFATIQAAFSALTKINEMIALPTVEDQGETEVMGRDISIENVSFGYNPDEVILKNLDLKIPFGRSVAIVGPTGSGKTTLAKLLTRQYDPDQGRITLGKTSLKEISRESLKKTMALVPQDPLIFHETVKFNLRLGRSHISDDAIYEASKQVMADTFISKLENGYDTVLMEGEGLLSTGQKQLLALGSVLVSGAEILIFDEATANIDTQTEILIQKAVDYLMTQKTMIIIAHRLSTIKHVDHIIVLKNGEVLEAGSHQELIEKEGLYHKMYQMQRIKVH